MKTEFWKAITLSTVIAVAASASTAALAANNDKFTIRLGASQPADHPMTDTMNRFKELAEKNSGGRIKVEVYPANQLGSQVQMNEGVKTGSVTITYSSIAFISNFEPKYNSLMLPFLVRKDNVDKAWKALDGDLGKELEASLEKIGMKCIGYGPIGSRQITNSKREIKTPADLKGIKIRLQPNAVHIATFKALGANPTALDFSEVYSALQQGVIDAQENPIDIIAANRFNEVQKYLSLTGHFYDFAGLWMNKAYYDKLPPELQKVVSDAGQRAVEFHRKLYADKEEGYLEQLKKAGMQVYQPTPEELKKFQVASDPVYAKFLSEQKDKDKAFTEKVWKIMGR